MGNSIPKENPRQMNLTPVLTMIGIWFVLWAVNSIGNLDLLMTISNLFNDSIEAISFAIAMNIGTGLLAFYISYSLAIKNYKGTSWLITFYILTGPLGLLAIIMMPIHVAIYLFILFFGTITGSWLGYKTGESEVSQQKLNH